MGNPNTISDHLQIEYIRTSKDVIEKPKYYVKRSYKNMDKEKFKNIIESDKNLEIAIVTDDTNVATNALQIKRINSKMKGTKCSKKQEQPKTWKTGKNTK